MNSIFGLKVLWLSEQVVRLFFFRKLVIDLIILQVQVSIGERHVVGVATGTAIFFSALPSPSLPTPSNPISTKQSKRGRIQKLLIDSHAASLERYGLNKPLNKVNDVEESKWTDSDDTDEDANDLDLTAGNKDSCVIEVNVVFVEIYHNNISVLRTLFRFITFRLIIS